MLFLLILNGLAILGGITYIVYLIISAKRKIKRIDLESGSKQAKLDDCDKIKTLRYKEE